MGGVGAVASAPALLHCFRRRPRRKQQKLRCSAGRCWVGWCRAFFSFCFSGAASVVGRGRLRTKLSALFGLCLVVGFVGGCLGCFCGFRTRRLEPRAGQKNFFFRGNFFFRTRKKVIMRTPLSRRPPKNAQVPSPQTSVEKCSTPNFAPEHFLGRNKTGFFGRTFFNQNRPEPCNAWLTLR